MLNSQWTRSGKKDSGSLRQSRKKKIEEVTLIASV